MSPVPARWLRYLFALWLLQAAAYFMPATTWNPVSRFALTHALVDEHRLSIDSLADATGDRALANGHWYTDKSPLVSLAAVPAYALLRAVHLAAGRPAPAFQVIRRTAEVPAIHIETNRSFTQLLYACALATSALPFAVLGALLFGFLSRRTSPLTALVATGLALLGTPLYPYATSLYGHVLAACALFAAVAVLDGQPQPSARRLLLAGLSLGVAVSDEYLTVFPATVLAVWALSRGGLTGWSRRLPLLVAGALAPVAVLLAYNTACFGAPFRTGYHFVVQAEFVEGHAQGLMGVGWPQAEALWGLAFSPSRGLAVVAPVSVLGLVGVGVWLRRHRDDTAVWALAAAFVVLAVANSGYYMWWGGASAGPRHLLPVLPVLAVGLSALWQTPGWRWPVGLAGGFSVVVMLLFCAIGLEAPEYGNVLTDYLLVFLRQGRLAALSSASNLGIRLGLPVAGSLGPLWVWLLLGGRGLVRVARQNEDGLPKEPVGTASSPAASQGVPES